MNTLLKKNIPLTLYSRKGCERVVCERWVGDGTDCSILTPSSSDYSSTSFSFCWAAQSGVLRATSPLSRAGSHCLELQLELQLTELQLTETICGTGLYNCLSSTCFLWASHLHWIQPVHRSRWYLRPDSPVSWLTARSKVNMLHKYK